MGQNCPKRAKKSVASKSMFLWPFAFKKKQKGKVKEKFSIQFFFDESTTRYYRDKKSMGESVVRSIDLDG